MKLLSVALVNFHTKQLQLYCYSNTTCCVVPCRRVINILYNVIYFTPLLSVNPDVPQPFFTRPQSTHTGRITNSTMAKSHSTALLRSAVTLCTAIYHGPQPQHITILRFVVPLCTAMYNGPQPQHITILRFAVPLCTAMYNGPQPQHITILRSAVPLCTMAHTHST